MWKVWPCRSSRNEPGRSISYKPQITCVPSEDSDQPVHPHKLIRVFTVRMRLLWIHGYPQSALSLKTDQVAPMWRLSLCWAFMQSCRKCCQALAQILGCLLFDSPSYILNKWLIKELQHNKANLGDTEALFLEFYKRDDWFWHCKFTFRKQMTHDQCYI